MIGQNDRANLRTTEPKPSRTEPKTEPHRAKLSLPGGFPGLDAMNLLDRHDPIWLGGARCWLRIDDKRPIQRQVSAGGLFRDPWLLVFVMDFH